MKRRSCVPKWIKREESSPPIGKGPNMPMNFKRASAKKWRPASNKGRFEQGGWALLKSRRG